MAAEVLEEEIFLQEKNIAMNLKELSLDKRQKSFIGLVEGADGTITPASKKNAWPEFIPEEAVMRIEQEGKQIEKITNNELQPIMEESSARKPI